MAAASNAARSSGGLPVLVVCMSAPELSIISTPGPTLSRRRLPRAEPAARPVSRLAAAPPPDDERMPAELSMCATTPVPVPEERLHTLVEAMRGQPVLMLVDLVVDRFISGTPKRISREAPVLILRYAGES